MKLKSLILGSVAAAGLSTAGYAADLGVLTSLDVCDALGLSGLTISSETNCLQISGGVEYEFVWGDYTADADGDGVADETGLPVATPIGIYTGDDQDVPVGDDLQDWESHIEVWLQFVGTASSDFGPASVHVKLLNEDLDAETYGEIQYVTPDDDVNIDEAYVSIGDTTVIMAGKKGSIAVEDDDEPFNFLGLFNSQAVDEGVWFAEGDFLGGHVIQVVSDLGNGVSVAAGLENLEGTDGFAGGVDDEGTFVGVVQYAGSNVTAHLTGAAIGILDGEVEQWAMHAGATGTFDMFKIRGAVGYNGIEDFAAAAVGEYIDIWNALLTAEASFDMFTLAVSGEYAYSELTDREGYGFGASIGAAVTEGVSINLGGRYFSADDIDDIGADVADEADSWQVAAQLVADLAETIKVTGELGVYGGEFVEENGFIDEDNVYYGAAELAWEPGGGFSSSVRGEVYNTDAYKVTFKAAKTFE
jgi:hypothetical protein